MAISTNPKPAIYRSLYEQTGPDFSLTFITAPGVTSARFAEGPGVVELVHTVFGTACGTV